MSSNDEIRRTFDDFQNDRIISYVDCFEKNQRARCRIYSYPYQIVFQVDYSNVFDVFIISIGEKIRVRNSKEHEKKSCIESNNNNQIIQCSHLTYLSLILVHHDYIEQFLTDTKTCSPYNLHMNAAYPAFQTATHNFARDTTRIN